MDKVWTIKNPSDMCRKYYVGLEVRQYGDAHYMMSQEASKKNQRQFRHDGEAVIVQTNFNGHDYYIMTIDNKSYLQTPQGGKEEFCFLCSS
jgi:hypothetical protein